MSLRWLYQPSAASFDPLVDLAPRFVYDFGDATKVTKDGSNFIDQIVDSTSNAYVASQTLTKRPLWVSANLNGKDIARFDGSNDFLQANVGADMSTFSVYVIVKAAVNRQFNGIIGHVTTTTNAMTLENGTGSQLDVWHDNVAGGGKALTGASSYVTGTWYRVLLTYTSGDCKIYIDGVQKGTSTQASGFLKCSTFTMSCDNIAFFPHNGDMAYVLGMDSVISSGNYASLETWAKARWALT